MGSAIPREGFFYMEFEDDEEDVGSDLKAFNGAILFAEPSKLSLRTLKQDLKHMVVGESDWQISQVRDVDFSVVFPSADLLHTAKSRGKLFLSANDITVKVRDTIHEEITPLSMPEVWLRLYGIPKKHRRVTRLMEGLKMLGRPIVVDELSLIRLGPVRMKFGCKVPDKMNGFVQVWFNHEGYNIKVEMERLPKRPRDGPREPRPSDAPSRPSNKSRGPSGGKTGSGASGSLGQKKDGQGQGGTCAGQNKDVEMACHDDELEDSFPDTSIDTDTWDTLGINVHDPLETRKRWRPSAGGDVAVARAAATIVPSSPGLRGSDAECVLNGPPICTPSSYRCSSGGSGRAPKMTAGQKPAANPPVLSLPSPAAPSSGGLQAALGPVGANAKAKRSKATPVSERAPSTRSKAALGDLSSLESAQLCLADKNLETSDDSGFALGSEGGPIVSMIRAHEEAQAALAEAADAAQAREANVAAASAADTTGVVSGALMPVLLGGEAEAREADATPSTSRASANKRVAKQAEWANRYALENQVLSILRKEEEYWRRRGGVKWITKGDANTGYFHAYANGRDQRHLSRRAGPVAICCRLHAETGRRCPVSLSYVRAARTADPLTGSGREEAPPLRTGFA
ncbi:hypothetical protein D1007_43770 [Hordeum vulgare]|nr:hypothetical protein D1007_43770 [Hordeum vulgare]